MKNPFKHQFRVTQIQHSGHEAMDLVCDANWDIVATEDGVVTSSRIVTDKNDLTWTYGHYIKYRLKDGTYILCAHLSRRLVKVGDKIKKGQVIGVMGSTGNSTAAHLHIEHRASNGSTRLKVYDYLGIKNERGSAQEVKTSAKPESKPGAKPSGEIKTGDVVKIVSGAVYTNGVKVPNQYVGKTFTVGDVKQNRALLVELYSWVNTSYLSKARENASSPKKQWKDGARVKIKKGAVYTNGVKVPTQYIGGVFTIQQVNDTRALLKELYSWVEKKYLTLQ